MASAMAFSSLRPIPSLLCSDRILFRLHTLRRLPFLCAAAAASSSPGVANEFNITFAAPKKPKKAEVDSSTALVPEEIPPDPAASATLPVLIPWIVRGEDGQLTVQPTPPARFLQAMAEVKVVKKETKKKKKSPVAAVAPSSASTTASVPPKYSKAARRFYNQNIKDQGQRLSKVLAAVGVASRRSCEELIFEGKVTVNGSVCTSPQTRVDISRDSIYVNGNRLSKKLPPKLYFALNKPKGYICSSGEESKSVISLFDDLMKSWDKTNPGVPQPRLFTVGRLDVATTGLIIVTNAGDFAQKIAHPSSELSKEYIATIEGTVHRRHLTAISEGTQVEGVHCVPDSIELMPVQPDVSRPRLRIVVHEGRNHEVRELIKCAGLKLYSLKRVRIGGFRLPSDLGIGKYVQLKHGDFKLLEGNTQKSS